MATKTTAAYQNEINRVVYEILTGESPENFVSDYMKRGSELEPFARKAYEMQTFNDVELGGFFEMNEFVGASPDGLIEEDGLLEIKCPSYSTMINYLLKQELPNEYKYQVYGQLMVTERKWCHFFAYHPKLKFVLIKIYPDEKIISELKTEVETAIEKVKSIVQKIKESN